MNILMLNYEYPPLGGGSAPVTKSLAEELVRQGNDVDVVTMSYGQLRKEEVIGGVQVYRVPSIRKNRERCSIYEMLSYCISATAFLPRLLKEKEYDVNHTHFIVPTGIVSGILHKKIPYIVTAHGSDVPGYNPDRFQVSSSLLKPFSRMVVERASCITSPSVFLKKEIVRNFGNHKIAVIPNGIEVSGHFTGAKKKKILTVSRLFERKGIQYVIEAMKDVEGFEYCICGEGPYRTHLANLIERYDIGHKVKLKGYLDTEQLHREYESAAIFILTSTSENFPVVLLEAMAAGCAVITSNNTGCVEVVGEAALFVEPRDVENIKQQLLTLINDSHLMNQLGKTGRNRVEKEFTWSKVAGKYMNLYKDVVRKQNL